MDGHRVLELDSNVDVLQGQATWRDDSCDAAEHATPKDLVLRCKSAPLIVCESQALCAELLLEYAVFLNGVFDGLGLVAVDPACVPGRCCCSVRVEPGDECSASYATGKDRGREQ